MKTHSVLPVTAVALLLAAACGSSTSSEPAGAGGQQSQAGGSGSAGTAGQSSGEGGSGGQSSGAGGQGGTGGSDSSGGAGNDTGGMAGTLGDSGQGGNGGSAPDGGGTGGSGGSGGSVVIGGGTDAASFHSVNWAVNGDNYQTGPLLLSGITSASDTYAGVQAKSNLVLGAFIDLLKANTVRVPINEPTVTGAWWPSYKAVIDTAIAKNMKVMVSYWAYHNGKPDDVNKFYDMWKIVVDAYADKPLVYFDIHNEPYGYSAQAWTQQVKDWIAKFPNAPKAQIIVPGRGWDDNVLDQGAAFPGMLLELHIYAIGKSGPLTEQGWRDNLTSIVGSYASRTIVGEWGTLMRGVDYDAAVNNNLNLAYVDGVSNQIFDSKMGSGFWPGLWAVTGNISSWSLLNMNGTGNDLTFSVQNASGLKRVQHSWGL